MVQWKFYEYLPGWLKDEKVNNVDEKFTEGLNILECVVFLTRSGYVYSMFWKNRFLFSITKNTRECYSQWTLFPRCTVILIL